MTPALVVIPVLNEAASIGGIVSALISDGFQVVVDDGGSTDRSVDAALAAGAQVVLRPRGVGPLANIFNNKGFLEGYARAGCRYVITMDAGWNHPPKTAKLLLAAIMAGTGGVILGVRDLSEWHGPRTLLSRFAAWVLGEEDATCGFRCYPMWLVLGLPRIHNRTGFTFHFVVLWLVKRFYDIPRATVAVPYLTIGTTSLNWRAVWYAVKAMVQLSLGRMPTC